MLHGFLPILLAFLLFSAQGNILIKEMFQFQIEKKPNFNWFVMKKFLGNIPYISHSIHVHAAYM